MSRVPHAFLIGLAVAVMAGSVWLLGHTQREAATRSFAQTEHAQAMLAAMLNQESGLRGYLLNRRRSEFIAPFTNGGRDFARELAAARRAGHADRSVDALLARCEQLAAAWRSEAEAALRSASDRVPLRDAVRRKELMDQFRAVHAGLLDSLEERRGGELERASSLSAALILLLSAVFGGAGWLFVGRPVAAQRRREARRAVMRERQTAFAHALQMSDSEDEAHDLVKRHLEASVEGAGVSVLPAEPQACLAVRLVAPHEQGGDAETLLRCGSCGETGRERSTCSPLLVHGEVIGSVQVAHDEGLDSDQREQVADTVTQAAPVVANLRNLAVAELLAATDALTGLPNRRSLNDTIKRMLAQAARSESSLSAVALDLDGFKQINDRHGHDRGDQVLVAAAAALRASLRISDFVARSGGEEFVVLLPDTGLDGAFVVAENLRVALEAMAIPGLEAPVTGSFGIAVHPEDAPSAEELLRRADRALYLAKRNGRNRIETAAAAGGAAPIG